MSTRTNMNFLSRINNSWVNGLGEFENPKHVFIMDIQGNHVINNFSKFLRKEDQILIFQQGRIEDIDNFFKQNAEIYKDAGSFVFLMVGMGNICEDAPLLVDEETEGRFHPLGPRQTPLDGHPEVAAKYRGLVESMLSLYPLAVVFSSDPCARRSGGFANSRARYVGRAMPKLGDRHCHLSLIDSLLCHPKKNDLFEGKFPIRNDFFEDDGVSLRLSTIMSVVRKTYAVVDTFQQNPSLLFYTPKGAIRVKV